MTRGLISFDIDGTLEIGDPKGCVTVASVLRARDLGYLVGSCSDRTRLEQREIWLAAGFDVDFVVGKQELQSLRLRFNAPSWLHIGDTEVDRRAAIAAGFQFLHVLDAGPDDGWLVQYCGTL